MGALLMCLPEAWSERLRSLVHDGLAPGQCVIAAVVTPEHTGVSDSSQSTTMVDTDSAWQRQAHYWQAEAACLQAELTTATHVPIWPEATIIAPQVRPRLRTARVIGWEHPESQVTASPVIRAGTADQVAIHDLVLAPGESLLDQGLALGIATDDLVLAGRTILGRISRTSRWTSTLQSITDPAFRGQAQIVRLQDGEALLGAQGVVSGSTEGTCRLLHIGTTEPVAEGDLVFTSLRGIPLSPPLFYGTITRAELRSGEPDWGIEVTPSRSGTPPREVVVLELLHRGAEREKAAPPQTLELR